LYISRNVGRSSAQPLKCTVPQPFKFSSLSRGKSAEKSVEREIDEKVQISNKMSSNSKLFNKMRNNQKENTPHEGKELRMTREKSASVRLRIQVYYLRESKF